MLRRLSVGVIVAVALTFGTEDQAHAKAKLGINAGASFYTGTSGTIGFPVGGLTLDFMGGKAFGFRFAAEFQRFTASILSISVHSDYLSALAIPYFKLGRMMSLDFALGLGYQLNGANSTAAWGGVGLTFNLGRKVYLNARMQVVLNPSSGVGIFDNFFIPFQLGFRF